MCDRLVRRAREDVNAANAGGKTKRASVLASAGPALAQAPGPEPVLPRTTNIRRVFVDNSTTPVTFWTGSNHGAAIIKLEPLD